MTINYLKQTAGAFLQYDEEGRAQIGKENFVLVQFRRLERIHNKKINLVFSVCIFSKAPSPSRDTEKESGSLHRFEKNVILESNTKGFNPESSVIDNLDVLSREHAVKMFQELNSSVKFVEYPVTVQEVLGND